MQFVRVTLASRDLEAQRRFYGESLGLPAKLAPDGNLHVQVGRTELIFRYDGSVTPFYHLAFSIATTGAAATVAWARQRVHLLADEGEEVFHSKLWNATQLYFFDADGNVLELLTRETSATESAEFRFVTEVGLPVADVLATVARLEQSLGGERKNGESATFNPVGDQEGLLIIVPAGRHWYPTAEPAPSLPLKIELRAAIKAPLELASDQYVIEAQPL